MIDEQTASELASLLQGRSRVKQGRNVEIQTDDGQWIAIGKPSIASSDQLARYRRTRPKPPTGIPFCFVFQSGQSVLVRGAHSRQHLLEGTDTYLFAASVHHNPLRAVFMVLQLGSSDTFPPTLYSWFKSQFSQFVHPIVSKLRPRGGGVWVASEEVLNNAVVETDEYSEFVVSEEVALEYVSGNTGDVINDNFVHLVGEGIDPDAWYYVDALGEDNPEYTPGTYAYIFYLFRIAWCALVTAVTPGADNYTYDENTVWSYPYLRVTYGFNSSFASRKEDEENSYLFFDGNLDVGAGTIVTTFTSSSSGIVGGDSSGASVYNRTGSGQTCVLPGTTLPWTILDTENSTSSSETGSSTTKQYNRTRYSLPRLINNAANLAIVEKTIFTSSEYSNPTSGIFTYTSTSVSEFYVVNKAGDLQRCADGVAFSVFRQGEPLTVLAVGELSFVPVGLNVPAEQQGELEGMPILFDVRFAERQHRIGIGTITSFASVGNIVIEVTINLTQVIASAYGSAFNANGVLISNNGSVRGVLPQPIETYHQMSWYGTRIYKVGTLLERENYAEVWNVNLAANPITFFRQPKYIAAPSFDRPESVPFDYGTASSYYA